MEFIHIYLEQFFIYVLLPASFIAGIVWAYVSIKNDWGALETVGGILFSIILIYPIWLFFFS